MQAYKLAIPLEKCKSDNIANYIKAAQTKFIKATMIKINDFSSKHVKKVKGQYILT